MQKTSGEWCRYFGMNQKDISNPNGWNQKEFDRSWNEKITEHEFKKRLLLSKFTITSGIRRALRV